jgi:O-antigen ligase
MPKVMNFLRGLVYIISIALFIALVVCGRIKVTILDAIMLMCATAICISTMRMSGILQGVLLSMPFITSYIVCRLCMYSGNVIKVISLSIAILMTVMMVSFALSVGGGNLFLGVDDRWAGIAGDPNYFGADAYICAAFLMLLTLISSQKIPYIYIISILTVCILVLFGSESRTALGSTLILVLFPLLRRCRLPPLMLAFLALASGLIFYILWLIVEPQIETIFSAMGRDLSFTGRTTIWSRGLELAHRETVLGWGYAYQEEFPSLRQINDYLTVAHWHNGYIDLYMAGGALSIICFTVLILYAVFKLFALDHKAMLFSLVLLMSFLMYNFTEPALTRVRGIVWLYVVLLLTLIMQRVRKVHPGSRGKEANT